MEKLLAIEESVLSNARARKSRKKDNSCRSCCNFVYGSGRGLCRPNAVSEVASEVCENFNIPGRKYAPA